jgi:hypothetical protein
LGKLAITLQSKPDGSVSGAYKASTGGFGTVAGKLEGSTLHFTLTQTVQACPGSYTGTLTMSGDHGTGKFSGRDCLGKHEHGVISFDRPTAANLSAAQSKP